MTGTNGLSTQDQVRSREKCPEAPGKRKFSTSVEAEKAAAFSSAQYHKTIVPYVCAGCGLWHVTGKVRGSDIAHASPDGVIRTAAMTQREQLAIPATPVARMDMEIVRAMHKPIVPGNQAAREKMLTRYLSDKSEVSTLEVAELLGSGKDRAKSMLRAAGWEIRRGPGARWRPAGQAPAPAPPIDLAMHRHPAGGALPAGEQWRTLERSGRLWELPLRDICEIAQALGVDVRLQLKAR